MITMISKYDINNETKYITQLQDECFRLVEIVATLSQVPVSQIFKEFDVRDTERDLK